MGGRPAGHPAVYEARRRTFRKVAASPRLGTGNEITMVYILLLLLGSAASYFGPWWAMAPVCFIVCAAVRPPAGVAFRISALAGITLWVGYSLFLYRDDPAGLSGKVAGLFIPAPLAGCGGPVWALGVGVALGVGWELGG